MLNTVITNQNTLEEIKNGAMEAKQKILDYYPTSNGQVYTVATGWLIIKLQIYVYF